MAGAGYKLFQTGDVLTAAQVNTYLNEQTVMVFANAAARTSALTSVLAEGMISYLQDTNSVEVYNGSSWVNVGNAGDITEVQAGTGISVASGTGPIPVITNTVATAFDAAGDLVYGTGADTFTKLSLGTAGKVLTVNSGATAPEWATPAGGGGLTLISDTQASANSSITFSSLGSYKQLILTWYGVKHSTGGSTFSLRLNNDSTASIYEGRGTSAKNDVFRTVGTDISSLSPVGDVQYFMFGEGATLGGKEASQGYVIIDNYTSTTRFKTLLCKFSYYDVDANPDLSKEVDMMMYYRSTSAVTSLDIVRLSGSATLTNDANTSIRLYGLS
jgi:hypothetical protein